MPDKISESTHKVRTFSGRDMPAIGTSASFESLVSEARDNAAAAWEYDRENREDGFVDLRFAAGDQWPASIRTERENAGRPVITINKLLQFVFQVANDIRTNPPGIKIVPGTGEKENKELAETYSGLVRSIENASNASNVYATAGTHAILCGQGNWRVDKRYVSDDVFEQEIVLKGIRHPFSVLWDPASIEPDRSDAEWCQVTQLIHKDTYRTRFPGASMSSFDVPIPGQDPEAGLFWRNGDWIRICEYWRKVDAKKRLLQFGSGAVINATDLKDAQIRELAAEMGGVVAERDVKAKKVRQSLLSAVDLLEEEEDWDGVHIPIISVFGGEIPLDTKVVRFGLIRFARDAQQLYNYARSAAAESIGLAPKSPYLVTQKMIARHVGIWNTHNTTNRPYLPFDPDTDAPQGPQRLHPPEAPEAFFRDQQICSEDMKGTTGIYDASLGARSNETSGVAINARDRQGDTATAHYQSNLITSMVHCGRVLIDLVPHVYDTQRIIRIVGEDDGEDFVPINHVVLSDNGEPVLVNDLSQGKYDVRPRTGPSYATKRLEAADSMLQFAQAVPGSAQIIGDLIAKNMDWPGADEIAERLKRAVPPQILGDDADPEEQNTPQAQAAKQAQETAAKLAAAQAQAKMAEQDAKTAKTNADAEKTRMDALNAKIDAIGKILDRLAMGEQISGDQINAPMWPDPGAGNAPPIGNAMGEPSAPQPMPAGPGQPLGGQPVGNALAGLSDNRPPPPMPGGMTPQAAFQVPTGGLNEFLGGNGQQDSAAPSPGADYGQSG